MRLFLVLFPILVLAFNIDGYNKNVSINKKYCYNVKKTLNTFILIDNYKLDQKYILHKLRNIQFIPHEHIHIYYFDNNKNILNNIFDFCVPGFTDKEIYEIKHKSDAFSRIFTDIIGEAKDEKESIFYPLLKKSIKKIPSSNIKNKFASSFSEINFNKQSRIFIFSFNSDFKGNANFNYSYGVIYKKRVPSKNEKQAYKLFFMNNKGYLSGINHSFIENISSNLSFFEYKINLIINNKAYKGHFLLLVDKNGNLFNSWLEIYGILLAPIKGKAFIKDNKLLSLKAEVLDDYKYFSNWVKKGDKIEVKRIRNKLLGKYYNYGYVLKNNPDKYFEYIIKE